jgi:hypothetical protein
VSTINAITYEGAVPVTASDTVADPNGPFAGFFTGAGGAITVITIRNQSAAFTSLPAGVIVPVAILRVNATPAPPAGVLGLQAMPWKGKPNPS